MNGGMVNSWDDLKSDLKSIHLYLKDGSVINGIVEGDLAVHEKGWSWSVIHLPTMASIAKAIPPGMHTKQALLNWCRKVQALCPAEWEVMRKLTPQNYNDVDENTDYIKETLQRWCLSTKVE
jgi:hypothetical protein